MHRIKKIIFNIVGFVLRKCGMVHEVDRVGIFWSPEKHNYHVCFHDYLYDIDRYTKSASFDENISEHNNLIGRITAHYHVIEKGLSMPVPRPGFGKDVVLSLISHLKVYVKTYGNTNENQVHSALKVLVQYLNFNRKMGAGDEAIENAIKEVVDSVQVSDEVEGGTKLISKVEYLKNVDKDFRTLALNRVSIRNFNEDDVDSSLLQEAIEIAIKTPSVCNRQSWSVIIINDPEVIKKALSLQNGNRGFGHLIRCLIVVKADLRSFLGVEERNQAYIDSGMFAMSLIYALQYKKLGAVPLNWAVSMERDNAMHELIGIPGNEIISMLIGVGHLREEFMVPVSQRKPVHTFYKFV